MRYFPPSSDPALTAIALFGAFALGAATGSFLNVIAYRMPLKRSIVSPPSACPSCGQAIAWYDNVPLLSYLLLAGRCRSCRSRISIRYFLVELLLAATWMALVLRIGLSPALAAFLFFTAFLMMFVLLHLEKMTRFQVLIRVAFTPAIVLLTAAAVVEGSWAQVAGATFGALTLLAASSITNRLSTSELGLLNFGLAMYIGLHLGWAGTYHLATGVIAILSWSALTRIWTRGREVSIVAFLGAVTTALLLALPLS